MDLVGNLPAQGSSFGQLPLTPAAGMPMPNPLPCPACGSNSNGAFCANCGTALRSRWCAGCGAQLAHGARFCATCGEAVPAGAPPRGGFRNRAWLVAGVAVLAVILAMVWGRSSPAPVAATVGTAGDPTLVDLASMTPRERFDRLYDRVMRAAENGDDATAMQFAPMALSAYAMLDDIDADARYHAAMIRLHTGDPTGAAALADTIRAELPTHLFSFVIHATLAKQQGDQARYAEERGGFMRNHDAEMAAGREEYGMHRFILDQMLQDQR